MANMNLDKVNARIFVNGYLIEDDTIDLYTINMSTGCISDNFIGYGATYSPSCEITMSETDMFNIGDWVTVQYYLDGEWVEFGTYVLVDEPVTEEGTTTIRLEGHLSTTFESEMVSFVGAPLVDGITISEALTSISIQTGVDVKLYGYNEIYPNIGDTVIHIPSYDVSENEIKVIRMSCREFVAGLSLLLGGNAIERNGQVYITLLNSLSDLTTIFTEDNYSTMKRNKKCYTPDSVILSYQPYVGRTLDGAIVYTAGDKLKKEMVRNHASNKIPYTINVECDWIGINAQNGFLSQISFGYNPAEVEFSGYHQSLHAGNIIRVSEGDNEYQVMCGIVEYEWDGGLTTKVSSVFSADNNQANTSISTSSNVATYSQIIAQLNDVMTFKGIYTDFVNAKAITTDNLSAKVAEIDSLKADSAIIKNIFSESIISDKAILDVLQANVVNADVVKAAVADVGYLTADEANLVYATINSLEAEKARISVLEADNATINGKLSAIEVEVSGKLNANELSAEVAKLGYATIENLNATNAKIEDLDVNKLSVADAKVQYAEIDLSNVGTQVVSTSMIKNGAVTNEKVGNLSANKITSGTIDASKITVTNLNADNLTVGTINGQRIGKGSLSLDKLSEEVATKEYLDNVQKELQGQIDGAIETFTKSEIPTLNNEPASLWTDNETRKKHIGDVCYVLNPTSSADGYCYRFANTGTEASPQYEWVLIKDSDVTKALQDIIDINGEITGIKQFDTEISSWKTDTDAELSSIKSRTTMLETDMGSKVESSVFNELKQTVDENSSSIKSLSTTVGKKADSSTVETLTNTVNSVKQTADTNTSSISSMRTEIGKKADGSTVTELSTRTSNLEQNLDGFKTEVSKTYTTKTEFDDLSVGGRNLARHTNEGTTGWSWSMHVGDYTASEVVENEIKTCKLTRGTTAVSGWSVINNLYIGRSNWEPNTVYTVSLDVKASVSTSFTVKFREPNGANSIIKSNATANVPTPNTWTKLIWTVTSVDTLPSSTDQSIYLTDMNSETGVWYQFKNLKIEKGNKATDWTPAPEDTEASITEVKTIAEQTADKFSWLVKSGTSATNFELTDRTATLVANQINLNGLVTFSGLNSDAQNKINNAENAVNNLEIGGRNLLIGSEIGIISNPLLDGSNASKYNNETLNDNPLYYMSGSRYIKINFPALKAGEQYTFSCDVARQLNGSPQDVFISIGESTSKVGIASGGIWTNFNVTFTASDTSTYALVRVNNASSSGRNDYTGHTRHFKLEKGNKATDWTPAPEDIDAAIDTAQAAADGANNTIANWCYNNDKTYINGGKIYTGSITASQIAANAITADKLNVDEIFSKSAVLEKIFAQSITATGTITGGSFVGSSFEGATGSFAGEITASSGKIGFLNIGSTYLRSGNSEADSEFYMTSSYLGIAKYIDGMRDEYTLIEPTGIYTTGDVRGGGTSLSYEYKNSVRSTILNIGDITINSNSPFGVSIANQVDDGKTILGVCLINCWPHSTWAFACTPILNGTNLYISTTTTQVYTVSVLIFYKDT